MFYRRLATPLRERLAFFPAVALLGARQVGKTTLARIIAAEHPGAVFLDLEAAADRERLSQPELFFARNRDRLVVLDEVQNAPEIFRVLRPEIDAGRRPGRFLLLGSASPALLRQTSESLAGRISYLELTPLSASEVGADLAGLQTLWLRGGFPAGYTAPTDELSFAWRTDFIRTFLARDLPQLGISFPAQTMHRLWRMLAHLQGQLLNLSRLGASLGGLAHTTVGRHIDALAGALMLRRLEPLHANLGKRLVKSPKLYVRDSGLLHALLNIHTVDDLQGHPVAGASWEGFVLEQIFGHAPDNADISFYRTAAGAELDLVVTLGTRRIGFEVKFSAAPKPAKGFWQAVEDLKLERAFVIAPVEEGYPLAKTVDVLPAHRVHEALG